MYREIARRKEGEEREILLRLADSESRHEEYWRQKLGDEVGMPLSPTLYTRLLGFLARRFGSVFALALMQSAETRNPYVKDADASDQIAADEAIHSEVVRGLAAKSRANMSGGFRAAVFGANDGLVSNLALVVGVMGSGMSSVMLLITGISGLLSGALSMAAGEFISVRSQRELLEASRPEQQSFSKARELDVDANELALVYRARGMSPEQADERAAALLGRLHAGQDEAAVTSLRGGEQSFGDEAGNNPWVAALSSFCCFGLGAFVPVLPFLFGVSPAPGAVIALVLVALALMVTGGITGVLSGKPPLYRALRQLMVGMVAAGVTWLLGLAFGTVVS